MSYAGESFMKLLSLLLCANDRCYANRRSPMTDEERQRAMDFIVTQQAKNSVEIEKLIDSHRRAEHRLGLTEQRLDRDERILKLMIKAGRRGHREMREHDRRIREQDEHFRQRYDEMLE